MVDEEMAGATLTAVTTENATSVTVDDDRFEVADGNLKLKDDMSLDFEGDDGGSVVVTITASGDGESAEHPVTVTINDVNEMPTIDVRDGEVVPQKDVTSSLTIDESVMGSDLPPLALIEVMDADAADATTGQDGADMVTISGDMADYFEVKLDPENGLWLALKADASLDYETVGSSVMLTVTYTDSAGQSASADVTVMINNVNEAPEVDGEVANAVFVGGQENSMEVDLKALFMDPDGDRLTYSLSDNAPEWLELSVTIAGSGDDQTITGTISGTPPADDDMTVDGVSIIASDDGGLSSEAEFDVVVDAANDAPTRLELRVRDDDLIVRTTEVDVAENDAGATLGTIVVRDPDDERHPHGQHEFSFMSGGAADDRFEVVDGKLKLKDDVSLNYEQGREIELTITAKDMYVTAPGEDDEDTRESISLDVTITVGDVAAGDGPMANKIGDWWVTVDEDLDAEDVLKGDWLSFRLRIDGLDSNPAFSDEDGQTLTFSLADDAPDWLQIDEKGRFTNKAEMLPETGAYTINVIATDPDGNSATGSFTLAVAVGDVDHSDNEDPRIRGVIEYEYTEPSGAEFGGQLVAEFTVEDDDLPIAPHPYGTLKVEIVSATQEGGRNVKSLFNLVEVEGDPDNDPTTTQYQVWTKSAAELAMDDKGKALKTPIKPLDFEAGDDVDILVRVTDAPRTSRIPSESDTQEITIDLNDAEDEAPSFDNPSGSTRKVDAMTKMGTTTFTVDQQENNKEIIVLQLADVWSDSDTDTDDLRFKPIDDSGLPDWISVYGPNRWEIIERRVDVTPSSSPDDRDMVVAIVIDRTAATGNNTDTGVALASFELTAYDPDGNSTTETISFDVTDRNVAITEDEDDPVVTINGDPNGLGALTMTFDAAQDPDLDGADDAELVVYTWSTIDAGTDTEFGTDDDVTTVIMVSSTPQPLPLDAGLVTGTTARDRTNDFEGLKIEAKVEYYEVNPGNMGIDESMAYTESTDAVEQASSTARTAVSFDVTTAATGLSVTIFASGEARDTAGSTARLQSSTDGSSGWQNVSGTLQDAIADATTGLTTALTMAVDGNGDGTTTTGDGAGLYYRVVYVYEDENGNDVEATSEVIQLGTVADPITGATTNILGADAGTPVDAGGTIRVDTQGNDAEVQWQVRDNATSPWMDIADANDPELDVMGAYANKDLRAKVTYTADDDPATTDVNEDGWPIWVEYTGVIDVAGRTNVVPVTSEATHEVRVELKAASMGNQPTKVEMDSVASLFFDSDGDDLTYTITTAPTVTVDATAAQAGPPAVPATPGAATDFTAGGVWRVFETEDEAGTDERTDDVHQSLAIDKNTGKLTYVTDISQTHDGNPNDGSDGGSNVLTFTITATDNMANTATPPTATVTVRINVAPTAIELNDGTATAANLPAPGMGVTGTALTDSNGDVTYTDDEENDAAEVATIDVMDQNASGDAFGTHKVTLSGRGSDQFEVVETTTGDTDGSTWEIRLKDDAKFDFEALKLPTETGDSITLSITVTATDGGGLSTKGVFSVKVMDADTDDDPETVTPTPVTPADPTVPGLKDDSGGLDDDGPVVPPPPGASIIDDLDDLHVDIDLLDEFVLAIDDIDVA